MTESNLPHNQFSDDDFDAFLHDAVEKDATLTVKELLREEMFVYFNAVLGEHGYRSLDEDPDYYQEVYQTEFETYFAAAMEQYGEDLPEEAFEDIKHLSENIAHIRTRNRAHFEKFLIDFGLNSAVMYQVALSSMPDASQAARQALLASVLDAKREVYANMVVKHDFPATNTVLQSLVDFLPGGPAETDDSAMISYYAQAMAAVPENAIQNAKLSALTTEACKIVGIDPDPLADNNPHEIEKIHQIALLTHAGVVLSTELTISEREARLREIAREQTLLLSTENIDSILALIDTAYPALKA